MRNIRIGTRESQLAIWQATLVQDQLSTLGIPSELVPITSEGDLDLVTPLYEIGVQGIFTRTLDAALLNNRIDIAVHSMKDVPVQLAQGVRQSAVLKRDSFKDILVLHPHISRHEASFLTDFVQVAVGSEHASNSQWRSSVQKHSDPHRQQEDAVIATSSIRRIAQWLNRYPTHKMENLRGNVNTRLKKLKDSNWHGAIFAAAGLERINLRPENSIDLDWMLPAPAQGAIVVVCRENDEYTFESCQPLNHEETALCTKIERDFLTTLLGGCSTPISALATVANEELIFTGNIASPDGNGIAHIQHHIPLAASSNVGFVAAKDILERGGQDIIDKVRNGDR